jgi:hypothetical protein
MKRIDRIKMTAEEMGIKNKGGLHDLFDNAFKGTFRLSDDEYDYIAEHGSDEDFDSLMPAMKMEGKPTFAEKRVIAKTLEKYLIQFKNQKT